MITEGDTAEEALENVRDALAATIEIYEDLGKPFPAELRFDPQSAPITFEGVVTQP
jgi:antitoxin HicB